MERLRPSGDETKKCSKENRARREINELFRYGVRGYPLFSVLRELFQPVEQTLIACPPPPTLTRAPPGGFSPCPRPFCAVLSCTMLCGAVTTDVVLAVGCEAGIVQLFDVRNMSAFLKVQDPVAGNIQQVFFFVNGDTIRVVPAASQADENRACVER